MSFPRKRESSNHRKGCGVLDSRLRGNDAPCLPESNRFYLTGIGAKSQPWLQGNRNNRLRTIALRPDHPAYLPTARIAASQARAIL
jgi:hypothetical protein